MRAKVLGTVTVVVVIVEEVIVIVIGDIVDIPIANQNFLEDRIRDQDIGNIVESIGVRVLLGIYVSSTTF